MCLVITEKHIYVYAIKNVYTVVWVLCSYETSPLGYREYMLTKRMILEEWRMFTGTPGM